MTVWVVTYKEKGKREPIVTVFDNREAAEKMYNNIMDSKNKWLDETSVYSSYILMH